MTNGMVKFSAEVAKGISVGTKDVTIKLLIPLAAVESRLSALAKMQEKEVMVYLGDPQGAFDFDDEERDPMYNPWNSGRRVTTDSSGVVTQIEKPGSEPEHDENQAQLFGPAEPPTDQEQPTGDGQETGEGDAQPTVPPTSSDDPGIDPNDPYGDNYDNDIPDWMKDGGDDQSGSKEMDFTSSDGSEGDQPPTVTQQDPPAADKANPPAEIGKEELEMFILNKRPIFDDIKLADAPADFPTLLQQRNEGKTWMEISKEINVPSGQISTKYGAYKKRVTKMMQDGVAV